MKEREFGNGIRDGIRDGFREELGFFGRFVD